MPWKVPAQISELVIPPVLLTCRAILSTRRIISLAARREKVMRRMRRGSAPFTMRWAIR